MRLAICLLITCLSIGSLSAYSQTRPKGTTATKSKSSKTTKGKTAKRKKTATIQYGTASFYHNRFNGRRTANGEIFNQKNLTAAHNSLPLNTWVKVTNLKNKRTVIVKITDRLHHRNSRILDLSKAAATKLAFSTGLLSVKLQILGKSNPMTKVK